jgi:site-specific recombinase XerD
VYDLVYQLKCLVEHRREGSYATQANRKDILLLAGRQLVESGYKQLSLYELKGRHVNRLLALWQGQGLSPATIKNRMAALRWWAKKIQNPGALKPSNDAYNIPRRTSIATVSKARDLAPDILARVTDRYVRMSLELQRAFGLRREEAIKIKPWQADKHVSLVLQGSWCKNGRPREVPIVTDQQRDVLARAKALVRFKSHALIPRGKSYAQQLKVYTYQCRKAGIDHTHGLRHAYAQTLFREMTGFPAPVAGGPHRHELTPAQRDLDERARYFISQELGHGRERITTAYLGR